MVEFQGPLRVGAIGGISHRSASLFNGKCCRLSGPNFCLDVVTGPARSHEVMRDAARQAASIRESIGGHDVFSDSM